MARRPMARASTTVYILKNPSVLAGLASPNTFDPQRIGDEIEAVPAEQRNTRGIWETYHEDRRSAIYAQLETDAQRALRRIQMDQIRLMQAAIFKERPNTEPVRAFTSFAVIEGGQRTYSTEAEIIDSVALQIRLLQTIRKEMNDFERRYQDVAWLTPMARAISERASDRIRDLEKDLGLPDPAAITPPPVTPRRGRRSAS